MNWTTWQAPGNAWVAAGGETDADPYLVWAEATQFGSLRATGQEAPAFVTVLVELNPGRTPVDLQDALGSDGHVTPVYLDHGTRYCTATFNAIACRRFAAPANGMVRRFDLSMPVLAGRTTVRKARRAGDPPRATPQLRSSGSSLLAVIDNGCPFAHGTFLRGGVPRILSLWDQDRVPAFGVSPCAGAVPANFGYGREVTRSELNALMQSCRGRTGAVDEDACYERAGLPELRRACTHGAHVLSQFVGARRLGDRLGLVADCPPTWDTRGLRVSDRADLVFVQLPRDTWADPNGLALGASVLDGLQHVLACKGDEVTHVVVNVSCATHTGPHDGSTILDAALAELVARQWNDSRCALEIFVPAGNAYESRWHAAGTISNTNPGELTLRVPPGSEAPAFLQLWVEAPPAQVSWSIAPPRGPTSPELGPGASLLQDARGVRALAHMRPVATDAGPAGTKTLLMLALPPAPLPDLPGPAGDWRVTVYLTGAPPRTRAKVDAYVARCESELGAPLRHRPSRLVDPTADPDRYLREALDDPDPANGQPRLRVTRHGTVGSPANGSAVIGVAGLQLRPAWAPARYSSEGLGSRAGAAFSDESRALPGVPGAGTRSGCTVRLQGTSFAAPQMARVAADRANAVGHGPRGEPAEISVPRAPAVKRVGVMVAIPRRGP